MSRPRILVTGATGNIGQALVRRLATDEPGVDVIAASPRGEPVGAAPGRALDLLDAASARQDCKASTACSCWHRPIPTWKR